MKLLALILVTLFNTNIFAEKYSMRDCVLLPITDNAGEVMGYKVYDEIEDYLKRTKWCEYKTGSNLLSVFSKYKERLKSHLDDPRVLKTVAEKVKSGSLIKISMNFDVENVLLTLEVVSETGDDVYYKEAQRVNAKLEVITETVINWLESYSTKIPYNSKVIGVLGEQLTFDESSNMEVGQEFELRRYIKKRNHKLLKTVVEWDSELIGKGKIYSINDGQALGIIKLYYSDLRATTGDWIKLINIDTKQISDKEFFPTFAKGDFGKLGELSVGISMANTSTTSSPENNNIRYAGFTYGIHAKAEAWITREYFGILELSRSIGKLEKEGGVAQEKSPSTINGVFKLGGGYKYLPMGFFFGPRINLYGGYASYSYGLDQSSVDGIGEGVIKGLFIGVGGDMPLKKSYRAFGNIEMMPFASFADEDGVYSSVDKVSHLSLELGAKKKHNKVMDIKASIKINNGSAKFDGSISKIEYKETQVNLGVGFIF